MITADQLDTHEAWIADGRPEADLSGADLEGAALSGANLRGADLRGADLRGAKGIAWRHGCGRSLRTIVAQRIDGAVLVTAGCRREPPEAVIAAIEQEYATSDLREPYIEDVRAVAEEVGR